MEGVSLPQDAEERLKLVLTAFQVISGEGSHVTCETINQANQVIWTWQHSNYGRGDCLVLLQMDIGPNRTFLMLNVMQLFIRYGFESWSEVNVDELGVLLKTVLERCKSWQPRVFDMALRTFCDFLIVRDELDAEFMATLDGPSALHFWADLCSEATEGFWKKYRWIKDNQVLPGKHTEITLKLLECNPMSNNWLQVFFAALKFYDNYDAFVIFLPKLLETVNELEMVKMVTDSTPCLYEVGLKSDNIDAVRAILDFTVRYSVGLRTLMSAGADELICFWMFCFWQNVLLMDCLDSSLPKCFDALGSVIDELFQCLVDFCVDDDVVYRVIKDLWNLLENFVDEEYKGEHPLRQKVVAFFQVCIAIVNKGVDPDQFPDVLQRLHKAGDLFPAYCAQFLGMPTTITPGVLTIVACNLKHLPPKIIRGYADFILSNSNFHQSVFRFIRMLPLDQLDKSYMQRFVELVISCLGTDRANASGSLLGLVQKAHRELTEYRPDLVSCVASAIPSGPLITSLQLIASTMFLLADCQDKSMFVTICHGLVAYLLNNDMYKKGCNNAEQILAFIKFFRVLITYCPTVESVPQHVAEFYNALVLEILKAIGDGMFLMCTEDCMYQRELCEFLRFVMLHKWLTDRSFVGDWLGILFDKGIFSSYYCVLLIFVPEIYTRPSVSAFFSQMRPTDDYEFNMATITLMTYIARNQRFFTLFKIEQLVLYLCEDQERVLCEALSIAREILADGSMPQGLGEWLFKFLYCSGFDQLFRHRGTRGVLVDTLKALACVCNKDALVAIVHKYSPYKNETDRPFVNAILQAQPGASSLGVQDGYFQVMHASDAVQERQAMLTTMFGK